MKNNIQNFLDNSLSSDSIKEQIANNREYRLDTKFSSLEASAKSVIGRNLQNTDIDNSYVRIFECIDLLQKLNIIQNNQKYIFRKLEFKFPRFTNDANIFIRSNILSFKFIDFATNKEIDTSKCRESNSTNLIYNIQLSLADKYKLNLPVYMGLSPDPFLDIYNPSSQGFTSRCYNKIDPSSKADTTLNYRRQNYYQNLTAKCNDGACDYLGINDNFFVNCRCNKEQDTYYYTFVKETMDSLRTVNLDIVTCPFVAFEAVKYYLI